MRIVTWNVYSGNQRIKEGLEYLFSMKPDIVCLQETPLEIVDWLKTRGDYNLYFTNDFVNESAEKNGFICLLSGLPVKDSGEYLYSDLKRNTSLLDLFYRLSGNTEKHLSLYVDVGKRGKDIRIQGMRLSTAVGPTRRWEFMSSIFKNTKKGALNIILGDLNVGNGMVFNMLTGLFRGFTLRELFYDERKHFDKLIADNGFVNVFSGKNTTAFPFLHQQFDHILVPKGTKIYKKSISESNYGSDHRILFVECEL